MSIIRVLACVGLCVCVGRSLGQTAEPVKSDPAKAEPVKAENEPKKNINKDATELLEKAAAAAKATKDLSATVEMTSKQGEGDGETLKGKILIAFKEGRMPIGNWRLEVTPKAGEQARVASYDGKVLRTIDPSAKEMTETDSPSMAFPQGEEGILMPQWYFSVRNDFLKQMNPVTMEQVIEGEPMGSTMSGEKVTVVRQVRRINLPSMAGEGNSQSMTETVRLWLAGDNLPRKVEMVIDVKTDDDNTRQSMVQTFADVKVNASPAAEAYTIKAPDGFKTRKVEASDETSTELKVKVGDPAKDFALKDPEGKEYTLASFKGKVVVLDFWATWCGPCVQAMPSIQKIHEHFKDKPVAIIGVNTWEKNATAGPEYMKKKGYTYLTLMKGDDLAKSYGISGIPTIIVFDGDGKVLHTGVGFGPDEEEHLKKIITEKLAK